MPSRARAYDDPPAAVAAGWLFYESCRCSGILKYKYRHPDKPDLELEWWPRYYSFRITYNGRQTKVPQTRIAFIEKTLATL